MEVVIGITERYSCIKPIMPTCFDRESLERLLRRASKFAIEGKNTLLYIPANNTIAAVPWLTQILEAHGEILKRVKVMMYDSLKELFASIYDKSINGRLETSATHVLMILLNDKMSSENSTRTLVCRHLIIVQ